MKTLPALMYGTAWKEDATAGLVHLAIESGFRAIDTANQRKHYFEAGVGEGIANAVAAGLVTRDELFLQTKFTYRRGQDHRLPYDPAAAPADQVRQSFARSLEHLGTDRIDSLVLHGPELSHGWSRTDRAVWSSMAELLASGRVAHLGVSNVMPDQLEALLASGAPKPSFVQNRCYARTGWDAEVRALCRANDIVYQGFSLLTANRRELAHPDVAAIAKRHGATIEQVVFRFAIDIGIWPLTGTTNAAHMRLDLAAPNLELAPEEIARLAR